MVRSSSHKRLFCECTGRFYVFRIRNVFCKHSVSVFPFLSKIEHVLYLAWKITFRGSIQVNGSAKKTEHIRKCIRMSSVSVPFLMNHLLKMLCPAQFSLCNYCILYMAYGKTERKNGKETETQRNSKTEQRIREKRTAKNYKSHTFVWTRPKAVFTPVLCFLSYEKVTSTLLPPSGGVKYILVTKEKTAPFPHWRNASTVATN